VSEVITQRILSLGAR